MKKVFFSSLVFLSVFSISINANWNIVSPEQSSSKWPEETQKFVRKNPAPQDVQAILDDIFNNLDTLKLFSDIQLFSNLADIQKLENQGFKFVRMKSGNIKRHIFTHTLLPGYFIKVAEKISQNDLIANDSENLSRVAFANFLKEKMIFNNITDLVIPKKYVYTMPRLSYDTPSPRIYENGGSVSYVTPVYFSPRILILAKKIDLSVSLWNQVKRKLSNFNGYLTFSHTLRWLENAGYPRTSLHKENVHFLDNGKMALIDTESKGQENMQYSFA